MVKDLADIALILAKTSKQRKRQREKEDRDEKR